VDVEELVAALEVPQAVSTATAAAAESVAHRFTTAHTS
jgi:hypothetical protein